MNNKIPQQIKDRKYYIKKFGVPALLCVITILIIFAISIIIKQF